MPSIEPNIQIIINQMTEDVKGFNGSPIDLKQFLSKALAEIVAPVVIAGN